MDFGIGQNLKEFTKTPMPESLNIFVKFSFTKKKYMGILRILIGFNEKF
jgi:hypothetical protein